MALGGLASTSRATQLRRDIVYQPRLTSPVEEWRIVKAARYYGNSHIQIDDVPEPELGPGQVLIDVAWCGVCSTDLREFIDGPVWIPGPIIPNATTGETSPVIIGHEISGIVNQVGAGVTDLKTGDHVVIEPIILPPDVPVGPADRYNGHPALTVNGIGGRSGGLSEKMAVDRRWVYKIDPAIPLDEASLIEPLSRAVHAVRLSGAEAGQTALVTGSGVMGLLITEVLKRKGVRVIISEPITMRQQIAREFAKADYVFDPDYEDIVARVLEVTDGEGVDLGFECSSNQNAIDQQLRLIKPYGSLTLAAWSRPVPLDLSTMVRKELTVRGSFIYNNDHSEAIRLVENGDLSLAPYITHRINLDDLISVGYETLINSPDIALKVMVSPNEN